MRSLPDADAGGSGRPLVSIITPSLNQGHFLESTIRSIRNQTYPSVEHIVVDGGSTDGTIQILRLFEPVYDLTWRSEPDHGMYDALNKGLSLARGEIIGYLNSDDVYPDWAIETAVSAFADNPTADLVFGDGLSVDEMNGRQRIAFIPPIHARALASIGSLVQPAVFWKRSTVDRFGGFDGELRFVGDLDYWLRIGSSGSTVRVDEILAVERIHGSALSQASAAEMAIEEAAVRRRFGARDDSLSRLRAIAARIRAALWRRRLWLSFLRSSRLPSGSGRGWDRFLTEGQVDISPARAALAQVPRLGAAFAWDAAVSRRQWLSVEPGAEDPPMVDERDSAS